jgi:AraC-like DNA-binding protein
VPIVLTEADDTSLHFLPPRLLFLGKKRMFATVPEAGDVPVSVAGRAPATGSGFAARRVLAALQKRNIDAAPLLRRVGLSDYNPDDRQQRISALSEARLVEYAAEATADTAFGLHLAQGADPREAGLLYYAVSAGKDVREALALFARYSRIVNDSVRVAIVPRAEGVTLAANYVGVPRHRFRQIVEFQFAIVVKALREAAGRKIGPSRVLFAHARISDRKEFDRFYNCRVEFGAPADALDVARDVLGLPLVTSDRHLLETLRPYCEEAAKARRTAAGSLRASVENEIYRLLPHGRANMATVAKALGISPRTLGRRLAEEETNFAKLIDDLRRALSLQYVREPNFTMAQIAWLLGYERSESFTHAFRRWAGRPPSQVRSASQTESVDAKMQNSVA